jgi:hypothetical protein
MPSAAAATPRNSCDFQSLEPGTGSSFGPGSFYESRIAFAPADFPAHSPDGTGLIQNLQQETDDD